jgi:hypothetical protein
MAETIREAASRGWSSFVFSVSEMGNGTDADLKRLGYTVPEWGETAGPLVRVSWEPTTPTED